MSFTVGSRLAPFVIESVSAHAMKEWSVFLKDPNPIHLDPEAVRAKGLGDRVINQGPANVAYLINLLLQNFPGAQIDMLESHFRDAVYAEDRLEAGGVITEIGGERVTCALNLEAAGRGVVLSATATVLLHP